MTASRPADPFAALRNLDEEDIACEWELFQNTLGLIRNICNGNGIIDADRLDFRGLMGETRILAQKSLTSSGTVHHNYVLAIV